MSSIGAEVMMPKCCVVLVLLVSSLPAAAQDRDDVLFGLAKVHKFHLTLTADAWQKMQPPPGAKFPGFPAKPLDPNADIHRNTFNVDFPWVKGDFTAADKTIKNVGVRFKGNFTYLASAQSLRRPLKIDLDHFDEAARLHGHRKLNLSNGITDAARSREALAFAIYRAAGVPASRTAYAELTLTVAGKYDKEYVGLYTLIEQIDKTFLKAHFKNGKGLLVKPEGLQGGIQYLGDDWKPYDVKYRPKNETTKEQQARLIAFARLVQRADDAEFRKEIGGFLDIDAFVRFMAADALMANLDSYLGFGHNFYLYLRPDTNKFVFIPWDLDLSMGMWPMAGPPEKQIDLSLEHPHMGQNKLIDRLLAMKDVKEKYTKTLKELSKTAFTKERILKDLDAIEKATKDSLAREKTASQARKETTKGPFAGIVGQAPPLKTFIEKRTESVLAQLAGDRKGYVPASFSFGPGGPGGPPPKGGFGPGTFVAKPLMQAMNTGKNGKLSKNEAIAAAKTFFTDCDTDKSGKLDQKQLAAGINRVWPRPPGAPAGFGPGNALAGNFMKRADADKDGKLTLDEFVKAAEALFQEADKDKRGYLDEAALSAGVNLLFPPPPGFGPKVEPPKK